MESQLELLMRMMNDKNCTRIAICVSSSCHKVSWPVRAAVVHAFIHAYDQSYRVSEMNKEQLSRQMSLEALVESQGIYRVFPKHIIAAKCVL